MKHINREDIAAGRRIEDSLIATRIIDDNERFATDHHAYFTDGFRFYAADNEHWVAIRQNSEKDFSIRFYTLRHASGLLFEEPLYRNITDSFIGLRAVTQYLQGYFCLDCIDI